MLSLKAVQMQQPIAISPLVANTIAVGISVGFLWGPIIGVCSSIAHVVLYQWSADQKQELWFPWNDKVVEQLKDYWLHTQPLVSIAMISGCVFKIFGITVNQAAIKWMRSCMTSPHTAIYMIFRTVIVAPFTEEVTFRGFTQEKTRDIQTLIWSKENVDGKHARITRVVLQAIAFGAAHYHPSQGFFNFYVVGATGLLGFLMGSMKEKSGNLWTPAAYHAHQNAAVVLRTALFGI